MTEDNIDKTKAILDEYLDGDQYSKFQEFINWLHYDKLKKKSR